VLHLRGRGEGAVTGVVEEHVAGAGTREVTLPDAIEQPVDELESVLTTVSPDVAVRPANTIPRRCPRSVARWW